MNRRLRNLATIGIIALTMGAESLYAETQPLPEKPNPTLNAPGEITKKAAPKSIQEAIDNLQFPGIKINTERWSVDIDATVALHDGLLELVACIKDTKEHESVVAVNAKPSQIHTALLLLGAQAGNPALRRLVTEGDEQRFIEIPPRGGLVDVYLVIDTPDGKQEFPINEFIEKSPPFNPEKPDSLPKQWKTELFPTYTFMFTGSVLVEHEANEPRQYVADYTGSVVTISTFGDELLGTPEIHDSANDSLVWQVRSQGLPPVDAPLILRLVPQRDPAASQGTTPAEN